jgi:hypothetical protein
MEREIDKRVAMARGTKRDLWKERRRETNGERAMVERATSERATVERETESDGGEAERESDGERRRRGGERE